MQWNADADWLSYNLGGGKSCDYCQADILCEPVSCIDPRRDSISVTHPLSGSVVEIDVKQLYMDMYKQYDLDVNYVETEGVTLNSYVNVKAKDLSANTPIVATDGSNKKIIAKKRNFAATDNLNIGQ